MAERRGFGRLRKRSNGRWQAGYVGLDNRLHYAPSTFDAKDDAVAWLAAERRLLESADWMSPSDRIAAAKAGLPPTLREYANGWLESRQLAPRTRALYRRLLDSLILPRLGVLRLTAITPTTVRAWFTEVGPNAPTRRAHAYALLKTILGTAVSEQVLPSNPCVIRAGSSSRTIHRSQPATVEELGQIAAAMPERLRLTVLIAAWCGLRLGEIVELRRRDLNLDQGVIHVSRAVARVPGQLIVGPPKSEAGVRTVAIPPHLLPEFRRHLAEHVPFGADALLFVGRDSGEQLNPSTLYRWYYPAREAAGRKDLRWHDLRHTAATLAAANGATLRELMARLGHSTVGAALRYQHAASDRDQAIAKALSRMATVTPIRSTEETA